MARYARKGRDGALYIGYREEDGGILIPDERMKGPAGSTRTGDIVGHEFRSEILDEERIVMVYRPPGYSPMNPWRYPVLYLNDGQNMFDAATSAFGVEWQVDETLEHLIAERTIQPILAVAVYNSADRFDEYTPAPDPHHGGGGADRYGMFLANELQPFINQEYRTNTEQTALMGSSLGGLCSLYLGWQYPRCFNLVAALSPSLWWAGRELTRAIAESPRTCKDGPEKIWLDMGTQEDKDDDLIADIRALRKVLVSKGYVVGENLFYREVKGAYHTEASWAKRVGDVLQALFPPGRGYFTAD